MAEHLLSNVYQVGGGNITDPIDGSSYLIVDPRGKEHMVIDCGSISGQPELQRQISTITRSIGRVATAYLTHGHFDHASGAALMSEVQVRVHENDLSRIQTADPRLTMAFLYDSTFPRIPAIETIADGDERTIGNTKITAIHTPGHTMGSICYKVETEEGIILIAGDTLWGCYDKNDQHLDEWEASLGILAQHNFDYVSFGHGIDFLIPDATKHIEFARSCFRVKTLPSHNGELLDPWVASWSNIEILKYIDTIGSSD